MGPTDQTRGNVTQGTGRQVASDDNWEGIFAGEYRFAPGAETFWDEIEDNAEGESDPAGLGHSTS